MIVDGNFLVVENVVQVKEVLDGHEDARVDHAVSRQERLELSICQVRVIQMILSNDREVLLRVIELVHVVFQVPLREALS